VKLPALLLFGATVALGQPFGAGLKVGLPLTDFVNTVNGVTSTSTDRFIVGPQFEFRLPFGLGIEFNALYRRFDYTNIIGSTASAVTTTTTAGNWELPLLLKYRFPGKIARPFVDAGVAWNTLTGISNTVAEHKNTVAGAVVGGGLDLHLLVIHVTPELRYTRWVSQHFNVSGVLSSKQDQAEFLVGITF
jgi:hypothetical protein